MRNLLLSLRAGARPASSASGVAGRGGRSPTRLTISSWGGAYTYEPDQGLSRAVHRDDRHRDQQRRQSRPTASPILRSMAESGNIEEPRRRRAQRPMRSLPATKALVREIDYDNELAPAPGRHPADRGFRRGLAERLLRPDHRLLDRPWRPTRRSGATARCRIRSKTCGGPGDLPRPARPAPRAPTPQPGMGALRRRCSRRRTCTTSWSTEGGRQPRLREARRDQGTTSSGGRKAPSRRSCWPTRRRRSHPPTTGRIFHAQVVENQPFEIIWDGQVFELDGWVIPAGVPDEETCLIEYLRFSTDTQRLAEPAPKFYICLTARPANPLRRWWSPMRRPGSTWRTAHCRRRRRTFIRDAVQNATPCFWADNQDRADRAASTRWLGLS